MPKVDLSWNDDTIVGPFLEALNLNKITGALNDANTFYPAGGTANDIVITTSNGNYSYNPNIVIKFKATNDATAAMTANIDSNGPLDLLNEDNTPFTSAETGKFYTFVLNAGATAFLNAPSGSDEWGGLEFVITELSPTEFEITKVLFNDTEYELTDDSPFRVSGVSV